MLGAIFSCIFVTSAVTCLWMLYRILVEPIPQGFSQPFKVKVILCVIRLVQSLVRIGVKLGLCEESAGLRYLQNKIRRHPDYPGVKYEDTTLGGVPVRVYTPVARSSKSPDGASKEQAADVATRAGIVFYHGGGWTMGGISSHHGLTSYLAAHVPAVVVSVNYRLAPEHPFPAGVQDCIAATRHFLSQGAQRYGVCSSKVVLAGDSAGGNLAAAVSIALRDEKCDVRPAAQVLIYPVTQVLDMNTPSYQQNSPGPVLQRLDMLNFTSLYITGTLDLVPLLDSNSHVIHDVRTKMDASFLDHTSLPQNYLVAPYRKPVARKGDLKTWNSIKTAMLSPLLSPLATSDLSNLPRAFIYTCHHDVLRDDGALYGMKLRKAGNNVSLVTNPIGFHGMISFFSIIPEAKRDLDRAIRFIQECTQ